MSPNRTKTAFAEAAPKEGSCGPVAEFGERSKKALETAHPRLRELFEEVVRTYDCAVLCGFRNEEDQEKAFTAGLSKARWPASKHNSYPSLAVDVVPWPIDWNDQRRFYHFAGYVLALARKAGIKVRWGGDWNGNMDFKDQNFHDLPHFELNDDGPLA